MSPRKNNRDHLRSLISVLPDKPGVYQFLDKEERVIYVGKAKILRKRVSSYFTGNITGKSRVLVNKVADIKHIIVASESDAMLLENNLIKKYQPRYNVLLKDDKSFPWICIKNEPFPRVFHTRKLINDGSLYFGPYTSMFMVRTLLDMIRQLYPLRTCKYKLTRENIKNRKFKVCLEYHIGNCKAPCIDIQTSEEYKRNIGHIKEILKGNIQSVFLYLRRKMEDHASNYEYEEANYLKEKMGILERYQSKSTIVSPTLRNIDVFSITDDSDYAYVNFLKVVKGAVIQAHSVEMKKKLSETKKDLLTLAITDIRQRLYSTAKEIIIPFRLDIQFLGVKTIVPKRGDKLKLLDLSFRNVKNFRLERLKRFNESLTLKNSTRTLTKIMNDLHLKQPPVLMECFDNSNIQGKNPVAACVVFRNARPLKKHYRHYNIKSIKGINDFASIAEVVHRRYSRLLKEKRELPQLVVVDGGKGQLNAAIKSIDNLGLRGEIAVIGIAKRLEEIYFPGDPVPLYLDKNSETLRVLRHLRNEAHRFGISFHRQKRSFEQIRSDLDNIQGIGPKTIQLLLNEFKSVKGVKNANINQLKNLIGNAKATWIYEYFQKSVPEE